jgi:leader peptidase (prepilin peptidase)/N-methyltransferase
MSLTAISPWILSLYAGAVGLVVGSFLNVVIHRLPRGVSVVTPRSRCPYCDGAILARDNIPVLSWVLLRGRCRRCAAPISPRYPLLEALVGVLFVACVARFGFTAEALVAAIFCSLLVVLAGIDLEHFLLLDRITLPGIVLGWAMQPWISATTLLDAVVGALVGAGALILLINIWYWLRDEESMGLGDVNMLAMIGAFLGWKGVATTLLFASLMGAIAGIGLILAGRMTLKAKLPFGFFLALGALVALFAGQALASWYGQLL